MRYYLITVVVTMEKLFCISNDRNDNHYEQDSFSENQRQFGIH